MHKKITKPPNSLLRPDGRSARLIGHAKAPGYRRCASRPQRRNAARGSGLEWLSLGAEQFAQRRPRGSRTAFGRVAVRRGRRIRFGGCGPGRRVTSGRRPRPSVRKATAGHQRPQPSGGFRPLACAGGAGRSDERHLRAPRAVGCFEALRSPGGVLRNVFGVSEGPAGTLGFSAKRPALVAADPRVDAARPTERLRPFAARLAFPPLVRAPPERIEGGPAEPTDGSRLLGGQLLGSAVAATAGMGPARSGTRRAADTKRPRRLRVREPLPAPRGVGVVCPPGHRRESDLSNPALRLLWPRARSVN